MFTSQDNLAITRTELDEVFYQNFNLDDGDWRIATAENANVFRPTSTTHSAYIGMVNSGTGLWNKIGETSVVPSSTPAVRNKYTIEVQDFGQDLWISKNLFDDNMFDVVAEDVKEYAQKARITQDMNAYSVYRGAFTTTLTPDGVAAISASHALIGGGTQSNLVTGALTPATLETATIKMGEMKDQSGVIRGNTPKILLVPMALWPEAIRITKSELVSDSADNAVNVFRSSILGYMVYTSPYLGAAAGGSDTAWFLLAANHGFRRVVRQGVQTALVSWEYSNNRSYKYTGNFREQVFCSDYAGVVGSLGT